MPNAKSLILCRLLLAAGVMICPELARARTPLPPTTLAMRPAGHHERTPTDAPSRTHHRVASAGAPARLPGFLDLAAAPDPNLAPGSAWATPPPVTSTSGVSLDLTAGLQSVVTGALLLSASPARPPWLQAAGTTRRLDPSGINALDRSVVGNRSTRADAFSDLTLATAVVLPFGVTAGRALLGDHAGRLREALVDTLVLAETFMAGAALCNLVKFSVRRPRPFVYDDRTDPAQRGEDDARLSFFSGHTAWSFTMATSLSYLYTRREPDSPLVVPLWVGTHALAATTGVLRVSAGKHFWTDVLTGALVGSAVGLAIPALRTSRELAERHPWLAGLRLVPSSGPDGGFGLHVMGYW